MRRGRLCVHLALGLLVPASRASAQQPLQSVQGVVRGAGRAPLSGADVAIGERQTATSSDGSFRVDSLRPGSYRVTVRRVGYTPLRTSVEVRSGQNTEVAYDLTPAPVQLPTVVVEGTRTGIYGTVADSSRVPAARARVQIVGDEAGVAPTDSAGRFAFPRATHGAFLLRVTLAGYTERRVLVELKKGEGREVTILLAPSGASLSRADDGALKDLGTRLSMGRERDRMTAQQLDRYSSVPLCDVPRIASEIGRLRNVPVAFSVNGVSIDTRADVGRLCAWRSDEVELVEFGIDVCTEATGTIATLANIWCSGKTRNLPRSIMNTQGRISTQPAGMRYVIVWERK